MKMLLKSIIVTLSVLFVVSISYAGDYEKQGLSLGVGGSYIFDNFDTGINELDFDGSAGFNAKLGYRVNAHFEGEIDYIYMNGFDGEISGIKAVELDGYAVTVNGKFYPSAGKVQPFVLAGIGLADLEIRDTIGLGLSTSDSDIVFRLGGGLDLYASENAIIFAEASYYLTQGDIEDTDFIPLTVGVKYKF